MMTINTLKGYFCVALAATLWGIQGGLVKILFQGGITPRLLVQFRLTLATIILFIVLSVFKREFLKVSLKDIPFFISLGVGGMAIHFFMYYYAISKAPVAVAIFLQYLAPAFVVTYSCLFMGERITRIMLMAIISAFVGCFLVVRVYDVDFLSLNIMGVLGGLGAAITWAMWSLHAEYLGRRYTPFTIMFYGFLFAGIFWNFLHSPMDMISISPSLVNIGGVLFIVVLATLVPSWLFISGIKIIRATRASITAILEPIAAVFIAYLFLGESMSVFQILGALLVIASIITLNLRHETETQPSLLQEAST